MQQVGNNFGLEFIRVMMNKNYSHAKPWHSQSENSPRHSFQKVHIEFVCPTRRNVWYPNQGDSSSVSRLVSDGAIRTENQKTSQRAREVPICIRWHVGCRVDECDSTVDKLDGYCRPFYKNSPGSRKLERWRGRDCWWFRLGKTTTLRGCWGW